MRRAIALCLLISLLFCGCARRLEPQDTAVFAMDTAMNLRIYGDDDGAAAQRLTELLQDLDAALSVTDPNSAVFALNQEGSSENETVLQLCAYADELCQRTGGAVDPSVYPALRLWGFTADAYRVPMPHEIDETLEAVGMSHVHLTAETVTLDDHAALDFGAFAKGYAGDQCAALLAELELPAVLTLGGNIQTVGTKPDGTPWRIGIADPDAPAEYCASLQITGSKAVVTSGDYQRFFEYEGKRYCHIFDPQTGRPVSNGLRSVTVVCDSGLTADGLSTALFVMGLEQATEFWRGADDFEAVFIDAEGGVYVTEGLQDVISDCEFTVIAR